MSASITNSTIVTNITPTIRNTSWTEVVDYITTWAFTLKALISIQVIAGYTSFTVMSNKFVFTVLKWFKILSVDID